jgi:hypothetical protein
LSGFGENEAAGKHCRRIKPERPTNNDGESRRLRNPGALVFEHRVDPAFSARRAGHIIAVLRPDGQNGLSKALREGEDS